MTVEGTTEEIPLKWYVVHSTGGIYVCATLLGPSEEMGDLAWRVRGRLLSDLPAGDAALAANQVAAFGLVQEPLQSAPINLMPGRGRMPSPSPSVWGEPPLPPRQILWAAVEVTIPIANLIQLLRMSQEAAERTNSGLARRLVIPEEPWPCQILSHWPQDAFTDYKAYTSPRSHL